MTVLTADVRELAPLLRAGRVDAIITDPPYEIGFMGARWDRRGVAFDPGVWRALRRLTKPGTHVAAFGGTKTSYMLAGAIAGAGFEIRDTLHWIYGSGMPKSRDVSKAIDKQLGAARGPEAAAWAGWGSNLKPAVEPIYLARNPLEGNLAENILRYGVGGLNVDACRVPVIDAAYAKNCAGDRGHADNRRRQLDFKMGAGSASTIGRFPPNVLLGHSIDCDDDGCTPQCPVRVIGEQSGFVRCAGNRKPSTGGKGGLFGLSGRAFDVAELTKNDDGTAARYFPQFRYEKKAYRRERTMAGRVENTHPTVKPIELMRWLVRLLVPPGGLVLDPFAGSGTTGIACKLEGVRFIGIELEPQHVEIARARIRLAA